MIEEGYALLHYIEEHGVYVSVNELGVVEFANCVLDKVALYDDEFFDFVDDSAVE